MTYIGKTNAWHRLWIAVYGHRRRVPAIWKFKGGTSPGSRSDKKQGGYSHG